MLQKYSKIVPNGAKIVPKWCSWRSKRRSLRQWHPQMDEDAGQGGQWTPRWEPKGAPEGSQRPNWEPQGAQLVGQGAQMVGQGSQMVGQGAQKVAKGSHKTAKMEPKATYERKCEHIKNIEKPKENQGFLRILGVWAPPERPQRPSKIKVWRLRGPKSGRSRAQALKKIEKK